MILSVHADARIVAWPSLRIISFGLGPRKMTEHCVCIAVHAAHVNLGLCHGAALDGAGMPLEGTGKALRHVKVRSPAEIPAPAFRVLVQRALEHRRQLIENTKCGISRKDAELREAAPAPEGPASPTGKVKWFSEEKGYGFVHSEGVDYHFSVRDVDGAELPTSGDEVSFAPVSGKKGPRAAHVSLKTPEVQGLRLVLRGQCRVRAGIRRSGRTPPLPGFNSAQNHRRPTTGGALLQALSPDGEIHFRQATRSIRRSPPSGRIREASGLGFHPQPGSAIATLARPVHIKPPACPPRSPGSPRSDATPIRTAMASPKLTCERHGGVMTLSLNRPEKLNAIDNEQSQALLDARSSCPRPRWASSSPAA